jgi:DNA-binding PadR family transcriptional regulator
MRGTMRLMPHGRHGGHGWGPGHGGRQRARRGMVRGAILRMLAERPMHGYELIGALEERTGGRWRPSPGSMYPALAHLEDEGLIQPVAGDDKRRYELTDAGRAWLAEHRDTERGWGGPDGGEFGGRGELRRLGGEIAGQLRQLGRFGSPAQLAKAAEVLARTRSELYALLANPPEDDAPADTSEA